MYKVKHDLAIVLIRSYFFGTILISLAVTVTSTTGLWVGVVVLNVDTAVLLQSEVLQDIIWYATTTTAMW